MVRKTKLEISTSDAIKDMSAAQKELAKFGLKLKDLKDTSVAVTRKGEDYRRTLQGFTEDGKLATIVTDGLGRSTKIFSSSLRELSATQKRAAREMAERKEAAKKAAIEEKKMKEAAEKAAKKLAEEEEKAAKKAAAAEERAAKRKIAAKEKEIAARRKAIAAAKRDAQSVGGKLVGEFKSAPGFATATTGEKLAGFSAISNIKKLLQTQKISKKEIARINKEIKQDIIRSYTGASEVAQRELLKLRDAYRGLGKATRQVDINRRKAANRMVDANKRIAKSTNRIKKNAQEVLVSWKSIIRILSAQAVRQIFFAITNQLREAVEQFAELSIKIAEVQTISQDAQLTTEQWQKGLRKLSDSFAIPILDQTEAAYQTLSNQVAKGAEVFTFLEEANRFAIAAVTDSSASVNLLTAAINAFNLKTGQADEVAASFFKTIELGRVRAEEMANSFGRIGVPAAQLGVSLNELNAAVATTTIRGVKFSEATTLIRNVLLKLIRPTKEMQKLFREWGVESGEAAIATFGLEGVLAKIEERTKGSSTELGNLFGRIRAITGAMIFAGEGMDDYSKNFAKIEKSTNSYDKAVKIVTESAGFKFRKQLNKTKNFFINDFGPKMLGTILRTADAFGGIDTVAKALTTTILISLIPATIKLAFALKALAMSNPFTAILAAVVATTAAIALLFEQAEKRAQEAREREIRQLNDRIKTVEKVTNEEIKILTDAIKFMGKERQKALADSLALLNKEADALDEILEKSKKAVTKITQDMSKELNAAIKNTEKNISDLGKIIEGTRGTITNLFRTARQELFEIDFKDLDLPNKVKAISKEIATLRSQQIQAALVVNKKEVERIAKDIAKLLTRKRKLLTKADEQNIKNEKKRVELAQEIAEVEQEYAKDRKEILRKMRTEVKNRNDFLKLQRELKELEGERNKDVTELLNKQKNIKDQVIPEINLRKDVNDELNRQVKIQELLARQAQENLEQQKRNLAELAEFKIELDRLAEVTKSFDLDKTLAKPPEEARKAIDAQVVALKKLKKLQDDSLAGRVAAARLQRRIDNLRKREVIDIDQKEAKAAAKRLKEAQKLALARLAERKLDLGQAQARLQTLDQNLEKLSKQALKFPDLTTFNFSLKPVFDRLRSAFSIAKLAPSENTINNLKNILEEVRTIKGEPEGFVFSGDLGKIQEFAEQAGVIIKGRNKALKTIDEVSAEIIKTEIVLKDVIEANNEAIRKRKEAAKNAAKEQDNLATSVKKLFELEKQIEKERVNRERRRKEREREIAPPSPPRPLPPPPPFAKGGPIGRDTIPAMLSPGEFVVNARASQRFFSQLTAINSGQRPQGFARGGPVTNVGDINVSMSSSGNESIDAVRLGKAIRREVRRGTIKGIA